jgi:hypothetical protein
MQGVAMAAEQMSGQPVSPEIIREQAEQAVRTQTSPAATAAMD